MILVSSSSSSRFSIYAACALLPWSELIYGSARPINSHSAARSQCKPVFWGLGRPSAVKMGVVHLDALIYACNESMSAVNKALHTLSTWHRVSACMCSRGRLDRPTDGGSHKLSVAPLGTELVVAQRTRLAQLFCIFPFFSSIWRRIVVFGGADHTKKIMEFLTSTRVLIAVQRVYIFRHHAD